MVLVDVETWITEYEACERLAHQITSSISQRDLLKRSSQEYSTLSGNIRIRLKQLSNEIEQLKINLNISLKKRRITPEEGERRLRQIETLQSQLTSSQNKFKNAGHTDRQALLTSPGSLWEGDDDDDDPPIVGTSSTTVEDLRKQQIQILEEQNKGLDALAESLSRQKNLASRLGTEVEDQNVIIDGLADTMERVDARVNSETRHIGVVTQQDKTCGYWVIIIGLFVAIVIVAIV